MDVSRRRFLGAVDVVGKIALTAVRPTQPQGGSTTGGGSAVTFKARANGLSVTADNAGTDPHIANRTTIGTWEPFDLISS